jgi:Tfp pilus assembly protein PilN
MIRINLLPEEYRKQARTPVKLLLGLILAVAVNAGLGTFWAFQAFGLQAEIASENAGLQTDLDGLTPQVTYYNSLDGEAKQYKSRESTLAGITSSRISWTKKLDELIDVVNRGGNGQRHLVWLDDLQVAQTTDPKAKTAGSLKASGHSGSDQFAQVANFLEDLETSTFINDFQPPAPPEGTQSLVDETLVPSVAWSFPLALTLKSAEERGDKPAADKTKGKAPAAKDAKGTKPAAKPEAAKPAPAAEAKK